MGFVLTKGGYKSHWPQVGNRVTWDRAHVTYFSPNSPHSVGGVHPALLCCHFNDSFPRTGASAQMGAPAGHGRGSSAREGGVSGAAGMRRGSWAPSCCCSGRPCTEPVPLAHSVLELHGEVPEAAPTANSLLSPFFKKSRAAGLGLKASRTHELGSA